MNKVSKNLILLVEDAIEIQFLLKRLFQGEGYQVQCASNGQEALDFLASAEDLPGLILLDFMMPVMDGHTFRKIQLQDPRLASIPVVVMTADNYIEDKSKNINANGYIRKPVNLEDLLDTAKQFCS